MARIRAAPGDRLPPGSNCIAGASGALDALARQTCFFNIKLTRELEEDFVVNSGFATQARQLLTFGFEKNSCQPAQDLVFIKQGREGRRLEIASKSLSSSLIPLPDVLK